MEMLPEDWIDRLFNCMATFYGERWSGCFPRKHQEDFLKVIWKHGLADLRYEQIKHGLAVCRRHAEQNPAAFPPHVMEFYRYAKGYQPMNRKKNDDMPVGDPVIAQKHLSDIKQKLRMPANMELYKRLGDV